MEGIEFETDRVPAGMEPEDDKTPVMVKWLMKLGVPDEKMANYVLIGMTVVFFVLSVFIYATMV